MRYKLLAISIFLASCSNTEEKRVSMVESLEPEFIQVCDEQKLAMAILDCVKFGNPKSDEEPEDLVRACSEVFRDVYCHEEKGFMYKTSPYWTRQPCSKAVLPTEIELCANWGPSQGEKK